jgi:hypothetical protein
MTDFDLPSSDHTVGAKVSPTTYSALPLRRSEKQIRLLHLKPGKFQAPLQAHLEIVSLSSNPQYEALSYVWGTPATQKRILLNDESFEIPITENLWACLQRLRDRRR